MTTTTASNDLLLLIQELWPDFQVHKQDVDKISNEFMSRFFMRVFSDLNDKYSILIGEKISQDEFRVSHSFDEKVELFWKVSRFFSKMNLKNYLKLTHFYKETPGRKQPLLKVAVHFLAFINIVFDEVSAVINDLYQYVPETEKLKVEKECLLQTLRENAEYLGNGVTCRENLEAKSKEITQKYHQILEEKAIQDAKTAEKEEELKLLQDKYACLEYQQKLTEEEIKKLEEQVISQEEYDTLRGTLKLLEEEIERLYGDNSDDEVNEKVDLVQTMNSYVQSLMKISFDDIPVATLNDIKDERHEIAKEVENLQMHLNELKNIVNNLQNEFETVSKRAEEEKKQYDDHVASLAVVEAKLNVEYKQNLKEIRTQDDYLESVKNTISADQDKVQRLEEEIIESNEIVMERYGWMVQKMNDTDDQFDSALSDLVSGSNLKYDVKKAIRM